MADQFTKPRTAIEEQEHSLLLAAACPGTHTVRQHRDGKAPWCHDCGRDNRGAMHSERHGTTSRVSGHTLVREGLLHDMKGNPPRFGHLQFGHGKCSCGQMSSLVDSKAKAKAWHRQHKSDVAKAAAKDRRS